MSIGKQGNKISIEETNVPSQNTTYRFLNVNGKQAVIELCTKIPETPRTQDLLYLIVGKCNIDNLGNPVYHFKGPEGLKDAIEIYEVDCMKKGRMKQMTDYYLAMLHLPNIRRGHLRRKLREFIDHPEIEYMEIEVEFPTPPLLEGRRSI